MPTGPMTSLGASVDRWLQNVMKIEYCTVIKTTKDDKPGVQCHSPDHPEYYNTVTVKVRDAKQGIDPRKLEHQYEIVIQDFVGNCFGHPWTPRVGDLVQVLFLYNSQPIILGPVNTTYQAPPFRAPTCDDAMYDDVWKWCQWLEPTEDHNHDYKDHPKGKMPICRKLFHGPVTGKIGGKGRDEMFCWDCQMGDADPTCRYCATIDSLPRSGEQWFKQYSTKTESAVAYNSRAEWHSRCGSYLRFESDDENSAGSTSGEYSEGIGHIRLGNAIEESKKRGHINYHPTGTIDIHGDHEEVSIDQESLGSRMMVTGSSMELSDENGIIAYEAEYLPLKAFIRIYRDGSIRITSNNNSDNGCSEMMLNPDGNCYIWNILQDSYVEIKSDGNIEVSSSQANVKVTSPIKVEIEAPNVDINCSDSVTFNTPKIYMGETLIHGEE